MLVAQNQMDRLRLAIAKAKAGQLRGGSGGDSSGADAPLRDDDARKRSRRNAKDFKEDDEDLEAKRMRILQRKAQDYEDIVQGRSRHMPAEALVDFEALTGARLTHRGGGVVRQARGATIAPPPSLMENVHVVEDDDPNDDGALRSPPSERPPLERPMTVMAESSQDLDAFGRDLRGRRDGDV